VHLFPDFSPRFLPLNAICLLTDFTYLDNVYNKKPVKTAKFLRNCPKTHRDFGLIFFSRSHSFGEYLIVLQIEVETAPRYARKTTTVANVGVMGYGISQDNDCTHGYRLWSSY
jgi:hypothetical protein